VKNTYRNAMKIHQCGILCCIYTAGKTVNVILLFIVYYSTGTGRVIAIEGSRFIELYWVML